MLPGVTNTMLQKLTGTVASFSFSFCVSLKYLCRINTSLCLCFFASFLMFFFFVLRCLQNTSVSKPVSEAVDKNTNTLCTHRLIFSHATVVTVCSFLWFFGFGLCSPARLTPTPVHTVSNHTGVTFHSTSVPVSTHH